ncbi:MAG: PHB depolymerase family esterase [Sandaracinaceae bacterium]
MHPRRPLVALASMILLASCDDGTAPSDAGAGRDAARADAGGGTGDAGPPPPVDGGDTPDAGAPVGSAGCGNASPLTGARTVDVMGMTGDYLVSLPSDYDPTQPYPLGFGFHGAGRTHENCHDGDCAGFQAAMGERAILVYIKSFTDAWPWPMDVREQNVALFEAVLDVVRGDYCVDEGRMFVAGTSSGASFSNVLGCRFGDRLLATAPVAGSMPETTGCTGPIAALVIHGVDDYHVPFVDGEAARDFYLDMNGCTHMPSVPIAELHDRVVMTRESHECADYMGCPAGASVRWCEHSEGGYDGSTHGWPSFGGDEIWSFVSGL